MFSTVQRPPQSRCPAAKLQPRRAEPMAARQDKERVLRSPIVLPLVSALLVSALLAACSAAPSAPLIESFSADPATLATTEREVTLSWEIQGLATTTYTLTAGNTAGSRSAQTTVRRLEPEAAAPPPNSALFGPWVFEIVGEAGSAVSGELRADTATSYQGTPGVWGSVTDCRGDATFCAEARSGGVVHRPGTDAYQFGLGHEDMTLAFRGRDDDGRLAENTPLHFMLEGRGRLGDKRATFRVYQLGK
jgi:hypothetical protein